MSSGPDAGERSVYLCNKSSECVCVCVCGGGGVGCVVVVGWCVCVCVCVVVFVFVLVYMCVKGINTTPCSPTDFKLVTPDHVVLVSVGDVTLPCHLFPQTSAVAMEIRWFKETDCIY